MHVFLRWYKANQPVPPPRKMAHQASAKAAILERFPAATFGPRVSTATQPTGLTLTGIAEMLFAYDGPARAGSQPIADILFPA
jgi:hypothetical protein